MEMVPVWLARLFVVLVMGRPQSTGRTAKLLTIDKVDNQHSVINDKQREPPAASVMGIVGGARTVLVCLGQLMVSATFTASLPSAGLFRAAGGGILSNRFG